MANISMYFMERPAGKMKLAFLENPSSTFAWIFKNIQLTPSSFLGLCEIACWYWPDLARIQATKLGLGRISLNFNRNVNIKLFQLTENPSSMLSQWS